MLTTLRLGLSHLPNHIFIHNFLYTINLFCNCLSDKEKISHFFSTAQRFGKTEVPFWAKFLKIDLDILTCTNSKIVKTLLFGDIASNQFDNNGIFNTTIKFIVSSRRSDGTLFFSDLDVRRWAASNMTDVFKILILIFLY